MIQTCLQSTAAYPAGPAMIPVRGYAGHQVAVLGLGRSGLPAIAALAAGGAEVVAWDDSPAARAAAEADGIALADLTRAKALGGGEGADRLAGHPASLSGAASGHRRGLGRRAWRSTTTSASSSARSPRRPGTSSTGLPQVVGDHRVERQVDDHGAARPRAEGGRAAGAGGRQHRPRRARPRPGRGRHGGGAGALLLPDRAGPGAAAGHRGLPQPLARPSRPARRHGRLLRGQAAALHPGRARRGRSSASTRTRGGSSPTSCARRRGPATR